MKNYKIDLTVAIFLIGMASCQSSSDNNPAPPISEQENVMEQEMIDTTNSKGMLPATQHAMIVRTNFDSNESWEQLITAISTPDPVFGFLPNFSEVNDSRFANKREEELSQLVPKGYWNSFMFVADSITLNNEEQLILCVDLRENKMASFRVVPDQMWGVENNLTLANMEFESFATSCDEDGVFRGF